MHKVQGACTCVQSRKHLVNFSNLHLKAIVSYFVEQLKLDFNALAITPPKTIGLQSCFVSHTRPSMMQVQIIHSRFSTQMYGQGVPEE